MRGPGELSGIIYNNLYKYIYINACPFSVTNLNNLNMIKTRVYLLSEENKGTAGSWKIGDDVITKDS